MMKTSKTNIFKKILVIVFSYVFLFTLEISADVKIVTKVNNEIITNVDIEEEYRYLIALNNDLKNLDAKSIFKIAQDSLIREKIKKKELEKYFNFNTEEQILKKIIENFYKKLNMSSEEEFRTYLENFDLDFDNVKNKIKVEIFWNEYIQKKFSNQININIKNLEKKIKDENLANKIVASYNLSEIVFEIQSGRDLTDTFDKINKSINSEGFKNTANIFSISDTSKFGGEIGWIDENQLSKKIVKNLQDLKIGEITKPISIANGFLILKLLDKKEKESLTDPKKILENLINYENNRQYSEFSLMHYNKIRLNTSVVNE
jgi:peptidyl-prolyl cis-trans isomerase SurA